MPLVIVHDDGSNLLLPVYSFRLRSTRNEGSAKIGPSGGPFRRKRLILPLMLLLCSICWPQAKLSVHWEELTASDFRNGIEKSQGTCLLPFGILEKHGPHLPLGTDLLNVRYLSLTAVAQEFAVVFPEYYFGQIFEAKHQPGTVAYSLQLQLQLLQETTDEMARNGCKKI